MMVMEERFWSRVDKSGECWLWTGHLNHRGYGTYRKGKGVQTGAHRFTYAAAYGPIPEGMQVDHTCYIRHCVNPEHLRLVTAKQNSENRKGAQVNSKTGIRGVCWSTRRGMWLGTVKHHGKQIMYAHFNNIEDAERAVIAKRLELFTHNDADRQNNQVQVLTT